MSGVVKAVFGGGGSSGSDDGAATRRAAEEEARKQAAREAVNRLFGYGTAVAGTAGTRTPIYDKAAVDPSQYSEVSGDEGSFMGYRGPGGEIVGAIPDATQGNIVGYNETPGAPGYDPSAARAAREAQIRGVVQSNLDLNRTRLDELKNEAARKLKFALARVGQRTGSTELSQSSDLQKTYQDQLRQAVAGADEIGTNLRTADEDARLRLLSQVESGADQSSLLAGAADTLRANVDRASAAARSNIANNAFENIGRAARDAADRKAREEAQQRYRGTAGMSNGYGGQIFRG